MARSSIVASGLVSAFVVATVLTGAGCGLAPATPQEIHQDLQKSLTASGKATPGSRTQYFGTSYRTSMAWEMEVTLENQSDFPITFGKDLILVEADASGGTYDGILVVIDPVGKVPRLEDTGFGDLAASQSATDYYLSNAEVRYAGGGTSFQRGNTVGITFSETSSATDEESIGFGGLESGETRTIEEDLELGSWVREEHRASLRLVLPELIVDRGNQEPARLRWVLYFKQPEDDAEEWLFNRQEVILLEPDGLEQQFIVPETNQVTRVLAANWLTDLDPERAQGALIQVGQGLREGDLLAVCLSRLNRLECVGFGEQAQSLLSDTDVPTGIRRLAAEYLGTTRYEPAFDTLIETVGDEESSVAVAAIAGLASFPGSEGSAALIELAKGEAGREYPDAIFTNLARTRQEDALSYLEGSARQHNDQALAALVREGAPESFDFFVGLARTKAHAGDRDQLARGLVRSGGERAGDLLMDWLAQEELADKDAPLATSTVVDELAELNLPSLVPRLGELASDGHLPALQVLSRYEDPSAREPLEALAREVEGTARFIVLDGISERWPDGNEELFEEVLREPTADLVPLATRALLSTDLNTLPSLLLPLMKNDDETIRREAASTLGRCDPGSFADGYLGAFLATTDDQIAADLASGLTDHDWKDKKAIAGLARKLDECEDDDMRFQVIRLMRHLSDEAMGPNGYGDFWDEPEEWTKRWQDWAKENASS